MATAIWLGCLLIADAIGIKNPTATPKVMISFMLLFVVYDVSMMFILGGN